MRKKRVMLWSLLCGVFLVGGASYLSKTEPEPLKAAEKTTATKTEKTAPVAKAKPVTLVARDEKSGIPILTPGDGDLPNFYLSTNPDFTRWDTVTIPGEQFAGMPTGWTTVYSDSTNMSYYANPTDKNDNSTSYNPDNWDMLMQRSQILSGGHGTVYFNWQRVQGGGIKTRTSYSASGVYNRASGPTLGVDVIYNPEMGSVFTVAADLQRTQMPTQKMGYLSNEPGYQYVTVSLFRGGSPNAVLAESVMESESNLSVDKVFEMVLDDDMLDEITNPSKGNNKIQLTTSNRMPIQWNSLAFYATNLKLTLKDLTGFTVPVGASFEDYFGQQDFVNQIESAEYRGVADGKTVTEPIDLENITLEGILDHAPDTSRVGERTIQVVFTATHDGKELRGIAAFPLHVTWGNSVALGGGTNYPANMSSIAFSLLKSTNAGGNDSYELIANNGDGTYDTVPVNSANPDGVYYQVDYFAPAAAGETLNLNQDLETKGSIHLTAKGSDTPADLIAGWGKQEVAPGGVLRVYMSDPTKEWLYQNDELNAQFKPNNLPQKNYVFYQVTETGLEPMYNNQVQPDNSKQPSIGKSAPAKALSNLFNQDANSHLTMANGGNIADYQFTWDFKNGTGTSNGSIQIPNTFVTGKSSSPDIAINFLIVPNPNVTVTNDAYTPWLPDYSKWKNSATDVIPKENAFVLRYSDNTKIVAHSSGLDLSKPGIDGNSPHNPLSNTVQLPFTTGGSLDEQWLIFSNLGYYNGKKIAVKMSIKPEALANVTNNYMYVGIGAQNLFNIKIEQGVKSANIKYDFFEQTTDGNIGDDYTQWQPIALSGYWSFSNLLNTKEVSIPEELIENVYSFDREYKQGTDAAPILLQYKEDTTNHSLDISSIATNSNAAPPVINYKAIQITATVTYKDQKQFAYKLIATDAKSEGGTFYAPILSYNSSTYAKVAIPDPTGMNQSFATITADQYPDADNKIKDPINDQFIQTIPFEYKDDYINNRSQTMTWTLPDVSDDQTNTLLSKNVWQVIDEQGTDAIAAGRFTVNNNKITANIDVSSLYNHTYTFKRVLEINDQAPIDPAALTEKNDGNYLANNGNVSLKVDDLPDVTSPFSTEVNFAANLPYTYELKNKDDEDVTPSGYAPDPTANSALITQEYKSDGFTGVNEVISNQDIDYGLIGYKIDGVEYPLNSEDLDTLKIKYTTNPVTLVYQEGAGAVLSFDVTSTLNFGSHTIQAQNDIPQESEWQLLAENALGYKVTAERTDFTADGVTNPLAAKLFLHFEGNDGESKSVEIPPATGPVDLNEIPLDGSWTIDSDNSTATSKEAGFSLNVPAGNITAGKQYKSEITFTLTDAP